MSVPDSLGLPLSSSAFTPPTAGEVWRALTLDAGFNATMVVLGTTLLGVAAGVVGGFALLRKRALMSDALSHATLPGVCLAFLIVASLGGEGRALMPLLIGAAATGVLGVVCVQAMLRHTRLTEDTAIGVVLSVFFGVGVVLLSVIQGMGTGGQGGLKAFIYGQTAAMHSRDAILMGVIALAGLAASAAFFKELALVCFDDDFAAVGGWPVSVIDLVMMALVVLVTVAGLQAVGLILVVALLIIPPAAARFWTERLGVMLLLGAALGGLSGYLGSVASTLLPRMPAGAVIVLTAGAIFFVSMTLAPRRGVIADALRRARTRLRVVRDHLLRAMDELDAGDGVRPASLARRGVADAITRSLVLRRMAAAGLARRDGQRWRLTDAGRAESRRILRNHRLWEQYLIRYADVASSHVDWSADRLEHILSPALMKELEQALEESVRN